MTVYILFHPRDGDVVRVFATEEAAKLEQARSPFTYDRYIGVYEVEE